MSSSAQASNGVEAVLVLAADAPQALATFYAALVGASPMAGLSAAHWRVVLPGAGWLELYRPSQARPQPPQRGRLAVCLRRRGNRSALDAWRDHATTLGAQPLDEPRTEPFGSEVWMLDPEGNGLLLLMSDS